MMYLSYGRTEMPQKIPAATPSCGTRVLRVGSGRQCG